MPGQIHISEQVRFFCHDDMRISLNSGPLGSKQKIKEEKELDTKKKYVNFRKSQTLSKGSRRGIASQSKNGLRCFQNIIVRK